MKRAKRLITYHGRQGHPVIHRTKTGRRFTMVRAKGGGTKRLYEGSLYSPTKGSRPIRKLRL